MRGAETIFVAPESVARSVRTALVGHETATIIIYYALPTRTAYSIYARNKANCADQKYLADTLEGKRRYSDTYNFTQYVATVCRRRRY